MVCVVLVFVLRYPPLDPGAQGKDKQKGYMPLQFGVAWNKALNLRPTTQQNTTTPQRDAHRLASHEHRTQFSLSLVCFSVLLWGV